MWNHRSGFMVCEKVKLTNVISLIHFLSMVIATNAATVFRLWVTQNVVEEEEKKKQTKNKAHRWHALDSSCVVYMWVNYLCKQMRLLQYKYYIFGRILNHGLKLKLLCRTYVRQSLQFFISYIFLQFLLLCVRYLFLRLIYCMFLSLLVGWLVLFYNINADTSSVNTTISFKNFVHFYLCVCVCECGALFTPSFFKYIFLKHYYFRTP